MTKLKNTIMLSLFDVNAKIVPVPYKHKGPILKNWQNRYFKNRVELENYLEQQPYSNYAIIPADNWIVYDVDNRNGGMESFKKLEKLLISTFTVKSGSGGYHYYYKLPEGFNGELKKNLDDIGYTGIDIKNKKGCLIAPESVHPCGSVYKIIAGSLDKLAEVPAELLKLAIKTKETTEYSEQIERVYSNYTVEIGNRNNFLTSETGKLFARGLKYNEVRLLILDLNQKRCRPPLPYKEVMAIIKSIARYNNAEQSKNKENTVLGQTELVKMSIAEKIDEIISTPKIRQEIKNRKVCQLIAKDLEDNGIFYKSNKNFYIFDNSSKLLIWLDKGNNNFKKLLYSKYNINPAQDLFKHVYEALCIYCDMQGTETKTYKFAHVDEKTCVAYVKNGNNIQKITPEGSELCDNGTDNVLFTDSIEVSPFEVSDVRKDYLGEFLLDKPNYSGGVYLTPEELRILVEIYIHGLFLPDILPTRPIISTVGIKGSGKTSLLRMIGRLLFGPSYEVTAMTNKLEDLDTVSAHKHILFIDNLDTYKEAINDKLACYATGIADEKRKLFSNGEIYGQRIETFIGISTRNPVFKRDDVAQRVLIIYLNPIKVYSKESTILEPLNKYRNEMLSQIIRKLQQILSVMKSRKYDNNTSNFRMADFAGLCAMFLDDKSAAENLLSKVTKTQQMLVVEGDILFIYLTIFIAGNLNLDLLGSPKWFMAKEVYKKLDNISLADNQQKGALNEFRSRYKDSVCLGKRLCNIKDDVSDFIIIETSKGRSNYTRYRFSRGEHFEEWRQLFARDLSILNSTN